MKKSQVLLRTVWAVVLCVFVFVFTGLLLHSSFDLIFCFSRLWDGSPSNVKLYQEDYAVIVDLAFELLESSGVESLRIGVRYNLIETESLQNEQQTDSYDPFLSQYEIHLYSGGEKIDISEEQAQSLRNICENSFGNGGNSLGHIQAYENQVEFWTDGCAYALIYTDDGSKPLVYDPARDIKTPYEAVFKKVTSNWYQMRLEYEH